MIFILFYFAFGDKWIIYFFSFYQCPKKEILSKGNIIKVSQKEQKLTAYCQ